MSNGFGPDFVVAALMLSGFLAEVCALGRVSGGLFQFGGVVAGLGLLFLTWLWLTLAWVLQVVSRGVARLVRGRSAVVSVAAGSSFGVALTTLGLAYLASWTVFLRSGRFASFEMARFTSVNARMLWLYLCQAEPSRAWWVGVALMAGSVGLSWALWFDSRRRGYERPAPPAVTTRLWGSLTLMWLVLLPIVGLDPSTMRRESRLDLLGNRLNPVLAGVNSLRDAAFGEAIEPCLETSELTPISHNDWDPAWPGKGHPPSIILIAVESLRQDIVFLDRQGVEVMPHLNALARRGLVWSRAYTQSTHSDYSDVCVGASLYPLRTRRHHYYRPDDPWPKTRVWDLLKPAGYATAIISSQNEAWGGMDQFLMSPNLDLFYDAQRSNAPTHVAALDTGFAREAASGALRAGKLDDAHTTDIAIAWLTEQVKRGVPLLLRMNYQNPHFPYEIAAACARPFQPCRFDFPAAFLDYPVEKAEVVRNAYYNALHETDRQLGRLIEALKQTGRLDDTILVVFGENGEAFHENGAIAHAGPPVEPVLRVGCVLHAPGRLGPRVEDYPLELIDVVPTALALAGWPSHPNFQGINVLGPDRVPLEERLLFFHTENAITRADAVLRAGRWKFHHDRATGRESLFDIVTDPGEARNVLAVEREEAERLRNILARWRRQQLAYYHYPGYYLLYYPPRAPGLDPRDHSSKR